MEQHTVGMRVEEIADKLGKPEHEAELFERVKALRAEVTPELHARVESRDRLKAITDGLHVMRAVKRRLMAVRSIEDGDAGHGPGHWCLDQVHATWLAQDPSIDERDVLAGVVGGALHDISTIFVERYAERDRVVRHAEAGGLLVLAALEELNIVPAAEAKIIAYAIAAHTHYLAPMEVSCTDGVKRGFVPYTDLFGDKPFMPVWLTRWADRLDCSGPRFIGRHWLTLLRDKTDYTQAEGFVTTTFSGSMEPLLRTPEERKRLAGEGSKAASPTMLEHIDMFATSQSNTSPYGKHDRGNMLTLRDPYRESVKKVVAAVQAPRDLDVERVLRAWTLFCGRNVEPSPHGQEAAGALQERFRTLSRTAQLAWANGFLTTMREYFAQAEVLVPFVERQPSAVFAEDREAILRCLRPDPEWVDLIKTI